MREANPKSADRRYRRGPDRDRCRRIWRPRRRYRRVRSPPCPEFGRDRRLSQASYRRDLADPPAVRQAGSTRLLDYGAGGRHEDGRPVLFAPSLVNRAYVLDLTARRSLLRWLAGEGFRPFLVDWGEPGDAERRFDLAAYVAGRLAAAFEAARPMGLQSRHMYRLSVQLEPYPAK